MPLTPDQLLEIERQLARPHGEAGLRVAEQMHATNLGMTTAAIDALSIGDGQSVLELGHGNAGHLGYLLGKAKRLEYRGLEVSETMHHEAKRANAELEHTPRVEFALYDGTELPFADALLDHAFAVNTIYFWREPAALLAEVYRVLKPGGACSVCYADAAFMRALPFVNDAFTLYTDTDFGALAAGTSFGELTLTNHTEQVTSKAGDRVERRYTVARLRKPRR